LRFGRLDGEEAKEKDESYSQHFEKISDCCFDARGQTSQVSQFLTKQQSEKNKELPNKQHY
jgi:hypothetical protein